MSMKIWLSAMRVRQWNKQALIILPLIALGDEVQVLDIGRLIVIAISFSLVASSIYIFNDLQDLAADKLDVVKSKRPFAAGVISTKKGKFVGVILLSTGFLVMFQVVGQNRPQVLTLFGLYLLSNLLYSRFNLKKIRILGLMIVGLGFAIRFSIGTYVLDLEFSTWAFVLILQLTMFMLSGKRFQTALRGIPPTCKNQDCSSGFFPWSFSLLFLQRRIQGL